MTAFSKKVGLKGLNPEEAVKALMAIQEKYGKIDRETVVLEARKKSHPLHKYFTWDDKQAAEEYRLIEAGNLIRALLVSEMKDGKVTYTRAFQNVMRKADGQLTANGFAADKESEYITTDEFFSDPEYVTYAEKLAMRELNAVYKKYNRLTRLNAIWAAIEAFEGLE